MNILMLTRFYLNGQTTHVLALCSELAKMGHRPILASENLHHPAYIQWLRNQRLRYLSTIDLRALNYLIKKFKIDVIHTHSRHTLSVALQLGQLHQLPVIATCHYLDFSPLEELKTATKVITISEEMQARLKLPKNKTIMIENGINLNQYRPLPTNRHVPKVVLVNRMTKAKESGYINLVNVLQNLGWEVKSIGNWQPPLDIEYTNWQVDLAKELNQADLVVGTGRAIREGMAAGCGALVLGDFLDGLVTPKSVTYLRKYNFSGRATKQVATTRKLQRIFAKLNPVKLQKLQKFSYEYSSNFSLRKMSEQIVTVYQSNSSFLLDIAESLATKIRSSRGASASNR